MRTELHLSKTLIILVVFIGVVNISSGQTVIDSLYQIVVDDQSDTEDINNLNTAIQSSLYTSPQEVEKYSRRLDSLLAGHEDTYHRAVTKNSLGLSLYVNQKFDEAIDALLQAMRLFEEINNRTKIARVSNSLAIVYQVRKEAATSATYWNQALGIFEELNDSLWIANTSANLGGHYMEHNEYDKANEMLDRAAPIFEKLNQSGLLGYVKLNQGSLRVKEGLSREAIEAFNKTFELIPFEANPLINAVAHTGIGNAYLDLKNMPLAKKHLQKGYDISIQIGQAEQRKAAAELLARFHEEQRDYRNALLYQKEWSALQDSFLTAEEDTRLVNALNKYEAEKKEKEIALLSAENEINELNLQKSRRNLIYAILGLTAISIIALTIYRSRQKSQKLNRELQLKQKVISRTLSEKEFLLKEIHHRVKNNLQVIASLLKLQSKSIADQQAKKALNEGRSRVRSMALIHQNLYQDDQHPGGINVREYISQLTSELFETYKVKGEQIQLNISVDNLTLDVDTVVPMGLIINELVSNSLKHAFPDNRQGKILIKLNESSEDNTLQLLVTDSGIGFNPDQVDPKSFGLRLIRAFADRLNAQYSLEGHQGTTAEFIINEYKLAA